MVRAMVERLICGKLLVVISPASHLERGTIVFRSIRPSVDTSLSAGFLPQFWTEFDKTPDIASL